VLFERCNGRYGCVLVKRLSLALTLAATLGSYPAALADSKAVSAMAPYPILFLDAEAGPSRLLTNQHREIDKTGYFLALRVGGQLSYGSLALEGGVGYFQTTLSGEEVRIAQSVAASGLFLDSGAFWFLSSHWSLGGRARWLYGDDTGFGPTEEEKRSNLFTNIGGYYHFGGKQGLRVGLHYQSDMTISGRDYRAALVSIGYGWDITSAEKEWGVEDRKSTQLVVESGETVGRLETPLAEVLGSLGLPPAPFVFEPYGTTLDPALLQPLAERLTDLHARVPAAGVRIVGHSDVSGDARHNQQLSVQRARWVYEQLVKAGVPHSMLSHEGVGSESPRSSNATPEGRAANRRVDIMVDVDQ
jgi:outer membrane protein OmpA-like peptidoglycan-associated protein